MSEQPPQDRPAAAGSCASGGHDAGSVASMVVLFALGSLLLARWRDGALPLYVHPGYTPFLALTGLALLMLAAIRAWRLVRHAWEHVRTATPASGRAGGFSWSLALLALAISAGALLPARPLGSLAAASQSSVAPPPILRPLTDETESWTLLEWAQAVGGGVQRERLAGRTVSVVGFVYRPREGPTSGETHVTRFVVRCCAADGFAVSLPVRSPQADTLQSDTWVHVEGVLRIDDSGPRPVAFVDADRLTVVPQPAVPYLLPT